MCTQTAADRKAKVFRVVGYPFLSREHFLSASGKQWEKALIFLN